MKKGRSVIIIGLLLIVLLTSVVGGTLLHFKNKGLVFEFFINRYSSEDEHYYFRYYENGILYCEAGEYRGHIRFGFYSPINRTRTKEQVQLSAEQMEKMSLLINAIMNREYNPDIDNTIVEGTGFTRYYLHCEERYYNWASIFTKHIELEAFYNYVIEVSPIEIKPPTRGCF